MSESTMCILNRETPVALAALIHTLRKAMRPEGRMEQGIGGTIEWETEFVLPRLEKVQDALKARAISPYEAAKQTMQEISEWLEGVTSQSIDFRMDMAFMKRREMNEEEKCELRQIEQEMQWCWKQGEKFAEGSRWMWVQRDNPRAMIESGQNPWKPSTLTCK